MAESNVPPAGLTSEFAAASGPMFDGSIVLRAVSIVFTTLFILVRIITRRDIGKFEAEDFFLILAYVVNVGKCILFIVAAPEAVSPHAGSTPAIVMRIAQESYAMELMYIIVLFSAKAAMLYQLRRTFAPWKSGPIYIAYCTLLALNLAFTIVSVVGMIVQCMPLQKMWDPRITTGYCVDRGASIIVSAIFNLGTDIAIFVLPLWSIWHLKKATRYRLSVGAVFATAFLAIVASAGRTADTVDLRSESDETNHFVRVGMWSAAETMFLIICPCFLFMPRFLMIVRGQPRPQPADWEATSERRLAERPRRWFGRGGNTVTPPLDRKTTQQDEVMQSSRSWSSKIPV